jgi:PLP dependent protein
VNDPELAGEVTKGLIEVRRRIDEATERAGRPRGAVRLIAVSKTKTQAAIRAAYAAGQRAFGENYAQELARKAEELRDLPDLEWHFIGHLQRNKAKQVLEAARAIHTVDRVDLAAELGKRATALGVSLRVLVEVNVAGEASKSGCSPDQIGVVLEAIAKEPSLVAGGLMTIPPASDDPEDARPFFAALRALRDRHGGEALLPDLSMGMSDDAHVAIAEGATLVRVGTAIFGARS